MGDKPNRTEDVDTKIPKLKFKIKLRIMDAKDLKSQNIRIRLSGISLVG